MTTSSASLGKRQSDDWPSREADYTIQDLEQKLDSNLEQLALIQWELEEYKAHTQEQLERLNMQKRDLESELRAKELEVKKIKRLPT
jgi:hypothetical protein